MDVTEVINNNIISYTVSQTAWIELMLRRDREYRGGGISSSPSWLINNRSNSYYSRFDRRDSEYLQQRTSQLRNLDRVIYYGLTPEQINSKSTIHIFSNSTVQSPTTTTTTTTATITTDEVDGNENQGEAPDVIYIDDKCSICLGFYRDNDVVRRLDLCGHTFHYQCIDKCVSRDNKCPLCRGVIYPSLSY